MVKVSRAKPIGQNSSSLLEGRLTGDDHTLLDRRLSSYNVTNSHNNRSSVNQMLEHLEWKSLEQRRKDARLTMMYKITNEKVAIPKEGRLNTTPLTIETHAQQKLPDTISSQRL